MSSLRPALVASVIVLAAAATASARRAPDASMHVRLTKSMPAAKEALATPPASVQLWFSERIELKASSVRVAGPGGVVTTAPLQGQDSVAAPATALVLGDMPPGAYKIDWSVVSKDGHPVRGAIEFTVRGR